MPIDRHEPVALVAPRGYHGADATLDFHADPRDSWPVLVEASKVGAMHGQAEVMKDEMLRVNDLLINGPIAYHIHDGGHGLTMFDWKLRLDHAETLFKKELK